MLSLHGVQVRRRAIAALQRVPGAKLSITAFTSFNGTADARDKERSRTLVTRANLRRCKLCLVPAGITPSSRRFYEVHPALLYLPLLKKNPLPTQTLLSRRTDDVPQALVAKCVPLLLADDFEPAFTAIQPLDTYALRAPQRDPDALPGIVAASLRRWPGLFRATQSARAAFIYSFDGGPRRPHIGGTCDATRSVLTELRQRFWSRSAHKPSRSPCLQRASSTSDAKDDCEVDEVSQLQSRPRK